MVASALLPSATAGRVVLRAFLGFFAFDDIDAHLVEHRHRVFDLLGRGLVGRQHLVQFVIGDIAALLGARDHLAHADIGHIQQRTVGVAGGFVLARLLGRDLGARLDGWRGGGLGGGLGIGLGGRRLLGLQLRLGLGLAGLGGTDLAWTTLAGLTACLAALTGLAGLGAGLADFFTAAVLAAAGLAACFLAGLAALADFLLKTDLLTTALLSYVPL